MKKIQKRKSVVSSQSSPLSSKQVNSGKAKRSFIIGVATFLFLIVLIGIVVVSPRFSSSGKAVHTIAATAPTFESGNGAVWIGFNKGVAAEGDVVSVPLVFSSTDKVTVIEFKIDYDHTVFTLSSAEKGSGFDFAEKPEQIVPSLSGTLNAAIPTATLSNNNGVQGSSSVFATLKFKVKKSELEKVYDFKVTVVTFKGSKDTNSDGVLETVTIGLTPNTYTSTILFVPNCIDVDNDNYGAKDTDRRACTEVGSDKSIIFSDKTKIIADCDDSNNKKFPNNPEKCDGWDNNCNSDVDEGLSGGWNSNLKGVCYGSQLCEPDVPGQAGWKNSYEVTKVANTNTFSDGKTTFNQLKLYSVVNGKPVELCDMFDNDCDGAVNNGLTSCSVGGIPSGLLPVGNTFIDYDAGTGDFKIQDITDKDIGLLPNFKAVRALTEITKPQGSIQGTGDKNSKPYQAYLLGSLVWLCDDGHYYYQPTGSADLYLYFYQDKLKKYTKDQFTLTATKDLQFGTNEVICNFP